LYGFCSLCNSKNGGHRHQNQGEKGNEKMETQENQNSEPTSDSVPLVPAHELADGEVLLRMAPPSDFQMPVGIKSFGGG